MKRKLNQVFNQYPLAISLIIAFFLRTLSAFLNYGPASYDDVQNIIDPALRLLQTGVLPEIEPERFFSLPLIFFLFAKFFNLLGVESIRFLVSGGFFFVGLLSLLQVWGIFKAGGIFLSEKWRNLLTLTMAIYFLSPFYATRVELDGLAMIPMTWAMYFLVAGDNTSRGKNLFWAGFMIALATYIKISISLIYFVALGFLFFQMFSKKSNRKKIPNHPKHKRGTYFEIKTPEIFAYLAGGAAVAVFMVIEELIVGRVPGGTVFSFLEYNYNNHLSANNYGKMPWYSHLLTLSAYFIPPISLLFWWAFYKGISKAWLPFIIFGSFVFFLSLLDYKLDRFLLPILPVFFLITFAGLESLEKSKLFMRSFGVFFVLSIIGAVVVSTNGPQLANVGGTIALGQENNAKTYTYNISPFWESYYGLLHALPEHTSDIKILANEIEKSDASRSSVLVFLEFDENELNVLKSKKIACEKGKSFFPSFAESIVIRLNPKFNNRRRKTTLYRCQKNLEGTWQNQIH